VERWATFDCYGTLIDWDQGIADTMAGLWPGRDRDSLLAAYHDIEPQVQRGRVVPYRQVMRESLEQVALDQRLSLSEQDRDALGRSLPSWSPFPEASGVLRQLRSRGWAMAILSNIDPDLLGASVQSIGVEPDLSITATEAGSYKPEHGHWETFRRLAGDPDNHVHVAASLFHDIAPCADLGIPAVWINRLGEVTNLPRAGELPDLVGLPDLLDELVADG
jgi:2-haloacid dehalogenase